MKQKVTRLTGVGIATAAMLTLAACGSGGSSGSDSDEILIGGLWATSGSQAVYGDYFSNGARLAVEDINAAGGVDGRELRLEINDTQALPEPAVVAFQRLVGQDAKLVLSTFSSQTLALMPVAESRNVPVINIGAQSNELGEAGDLLLNTMPLIGNESEVLANYLVKEEEFTDAAVIYTSDDGGRSARDGFVSAYEGAGGTIVAEESGEYQGTDYRSQLTKLRDSGADVLVLGAFGQDTDNIISQVREIGWDVPMANTSWAAIPDVLANQNAEGLILTSLPFTPPNDFVSGYEAEYGEDPNSVYIGNAYDAVTVFAAAYEQALQSGDEIDGDTVVDTIEEIGSFDSAYGSDLTFVDGVASRTIDVGVIEDGAVQTLVENYGG